MFAITKIARSWARAGPALGGEARPKNFSKNLLKEESTIEMVVAFNAKKQIEIKEKPVYRILDDSYLTGK